MKKNAAKIIITVSNKGVISLKLDEDYCSAYTAKQYEEHIKKYIECFNKSDENTPIESDEHTRNQSCCVYITYYSLTDLFSNSKGLYKMAESDLKDYAVADDKDRRDAYDAPTIHMTLGNIFEEKDKEGNIKDKEPYKRFARFMDSSIWNYYAPIIIKDENIQDGSTPGRYDFSYFKYAILAIINNSFCKTSKGITNLYEINVTKEYADINERIFMQSKLMEISGHGKNVSPFLFHSERKVMNEIERMKSPNDECDKNNIVEEILNYKWRILLVDDHDINPMRIGEQSSNVAKLDIIEKAINDLFKNENVVTRNFRNDKAQIYIDSVSNLEKAQKVLKSKKYEIILLDYLLDDNGKGGREYGYELLKGIWAKEENKAEDAKYKDYIFDYKKGPDNRFFFMFISAFTTAVSERLLTEGWARSEKYWYIGGGACPINTPYLFQYRLLHIMKKRMERMKLRELSNINNWITTNIFGCDNPREEAINKFKDVLKLMYSYRDLLQDAHPTGEDLIFETEESVLATDFITRNLYPENIFEHLVQLVYLTAFGTVRQWPEMWEEYQFIKSIFGREEKIEKYIVGLKNNHI